MGTGGSVERHRIWAERAPEGDEDGARVDMAVTLGELKAVTRIYTARTNKPVKKLSISPAAAQTMDVGEAFIITPTWTPINATNMVPQYGFAKG